MSVFTNKQKRELFSSAFKRIKQFYLKKIVLSNLSFPLSSGMKRKDMVWHRQEIPTKIHTSHAMLYLQPL